MIERNIIYDKKEIVRFKRNCNSHMILGSFALYEDDDKYEIWELGISEGYRHKGYATQMLTEFLSQFKSEKPLVLYVYKANKIAIHLYSKVGFAIVGDCYFDQSAYQMQYLT